MKKINFLFLTVLSAAMISSAFAFGSKSKRNNTTNNNTTTIQNSYYSYPASYPADFGKTLPQYMQTPNTFDAL